MNILLIENDEDLHSAILGYLEDRRYRVTACRTVVEATEALARIPDRSVAPDAIVSDADGMGFYMKARKRFPGIRWILTSTRGAMAEIGNPLTHSVESRSGDAGEQQVSPRLMDRFMPGASQQF